MFEMNVIVGFQQSAHTVSLHSALLGFLLLLATVKLKSGFSLEHFGVWIFISKVIVFLFFYIINNLFNQKS